MSADIKVFIAKGRMLLAEEWVSAIASNEFDPEFDVDELEGFLPCVYQGDEVGFEYYYEPIEDTMFTEEDSPEIKGKEFCVSFCSSFEKGDIASAMIAAGVLAKVCGGVFWLMDGFQTKEDPVMMAKYIAEHGIG